MHASIDLLCDGHIVQHFGFATSPNVADLSIFLNAGQWNDSKHVVLPIIIIRHSIRWISGALIEHYLMF